MKLTTKVVFFVSTIYVINGCSTSDPVVKNNQTFNVNNKNIVKHYKDAYYYRPVNAWSYKQTANSANLNNVASGGILKCKEK